ncbi:ATP-binding protein [Candidatus Micrarchaeota archaeon]|nr:ATP-binding protein [Candidatus Micrarchaeota archaeon]
MMLKETLKQVVKSQREELLLLEAGVQREALSMVDLSLPHALILMGVRRCGKSTLSRQLMPKAKSFSYFNFEDTRISGFDAGDFQKLGEALEEEYGAAGTCFFDEVQNVEKWELFVRQMMDKQKKFVITGSNASLLSRELGTRLTGRHLNAELFPFSFREMLALKKEKPSAKAFEEYLNKGGFPEFLKFGNPEILRELLNDIVARDIVVRHGLREAKTAKEMALYLITNAGNSFSYNGLKKTFNLGSVNTAIAFVSYFEDAYLLFTVPKFDYSLKKQLVNPKKVYAVDNGLAQANSASFSQDSGRMLENAVFLQLRRKNKDVYYYSGENECDFAVKEKGKITQAIQACSKLTEDNKKREIDGLLEALDEFKLDEGMIASHNQEDEFTVSGKKITVKPAWKWMLE